MTAARCVSTVLTEIPAIMHGEDQDFGPRQFLLDRAGQLQPVHGRQRIIHDDDIGPCGPDEVERVAPVRSLPHDLPVRMGRKDRTDAKPYHLMTVCQDDPPDWTTHNPRSHFRTNFAGASCRIDFTGKIRLHASIQRRRHRIFVKEYSGCVSLSASILWRTRIQ